MAALYEEIVKKLILFIEQNIKQNNYRLPTEAKLCEIYGVSRVTLRHSLAILEERGYITRRQGSGIMATGFLEGRNQIALILQSDIDYFYPALITDICDRMSAVGFTCTTYSTDYSVSNEREILRNLINEPPRMAIIDGEYGAFRFFNQYLYEQLHEAGTEIIIFNTDCSPSNNYYLPKADERQMGIVLIDRLKEIGHKKIACLFVADNSIEHSRLSGCYYALGSDENIFWCTRDDIANLRQDYDTGFLREFLTKVVSDNYTAVVCGADEVAFYMTRVAHNMDIRIPEDLLITAFGNSHLVRMSNPEIPTIHYTKRASTIISDMAEAVLSGNDVTKYSNCSYTLSDSFQQLS